VKRASNSTGKLLTGGLLVAWNTVFAVALVERMTEADWFERLGLCVAFLIQAFLTYVLAAFVWADFKSRT
jgi:hypothetical protein